MDEYVTLKNGRKFKNTHILPSGRDVIFLYVHDTEKETMKSIFDALYESEATGKITEHRYGQKTVYEGYTELVGVQKEEYQVCATLRKP